MVWDSIVGALIGKVAPEVAGYYRDKQKLKHELKLKQMEAEVAAEQARIDYINKAEERDASWEELQIQNSSWKDEWVLILLSIPLVLSFIPITVAYVQMGFAALEMTPDWYRFLILSVFLAIYGIRLWRRKST